mmetsp:Transcript_93008/g.268650  ORF Transcript_93008/g.268650 Transcript_93008/m.268650 type:complete len:218 (-) Transcript_93008:311-964(-)
MLAHAGRLRAYASRRRARRSAHRFVLAAPREAAAFCPARLWCPCLAGRPVRILSRNESPTERGYRASPAERGTRRLPSAAASGAESLEDPPAHVEGRWASWSSRSVVGASVVWRLRLRLLGLMLLPTWRLMLRATMSPLRTHSRRCALPTMPLLLCAAATPLLVLQSHDRQRGRRRDGVASSRLQRRRGICIADLLWQPRLLPILPLQHLLPRTALS